MFDGGAPATAALAGFGYGAAPSAYGAMPGQILNHRQAERRCVLLSQSITDTK